MAFGSMYQKWGILWRPKRIKVENVRCVVECILCLHIFVINGRLERRPQQFNQSVRGSERFQPEDDREERERSENMENRVLGPTGISTQELKWRKE
mmetsp:Transcript_457/g.1291  ORF Transcript_457/g.1291 Transcript_457/m.1291 type:complete len:96 (+) Transcript_457:2188-2475(+)